VNNFNTGASQQELGGGGVKKDCTRPIQAAWVKWLRQFQPNGVWTQKSKFFGEEVKKNPEQGSQIGKKKEAKKTKCSHKKKRSYQKLPKTVGDGGKEHYKKLRLHRQRLILGCIRGVRKKKKKEMSEPTRF